jgi:hypothetical protein
MESQGLHMLSSCLREKGLVGYLVLDLVLQGQTLQVSLLKVTVKINATTHHI